MSKLLFEHEMKVNRALQRILSVAFISSFIVLMLVFKTSLRQSSVLLTGTLLVFGIGWLGKTKHAPMCKYLFALLLAILLTALLAFLQENNTGIPYAISISLIAVAMYFIPRLVVFFAGTVILLNGVYASINPAVYVYNYSAQNWIFLTGLFILGAVIAYVLSRSALNLITYAEQKEQEVQQQNTNIINLYDKIKSVVNQVTSIGTDLSTSTAQTASALTQVAATIQEFTATTDTVSNTSKHIAQATNEVDDLANQGLKQMENTQVVMTEVINASEESQEVVEDLVDATNEIASIIDIIASIAEQTNLLALNAAIESARAGEQGRGFAVVADEIRKLAEETQRSTASIQNLIQSFIEQTKVVKETFVHSNLQTKTGYASLNETELMLKTIVERIGEVAIEIQAIASATQELNAGSEEIAASTQQQEVAVQHLSALAESLAEVTKELDAVVNG